MHAQDLIVDLEYLAKLIMDKNSNLSHDTYRLFVKYHAQARLALQKYTAINPSETQPVQYWEDRLTKVCIELKNINIASNIFQEHQDFIPKEDRQALEDILQAY